MNAVQRILNGAADCLESDGWKQRGFGSRGGPMCASMALSTQTTDADLRSAASRALGEQLTGWGSIMEWSDAPGMTADEVIRTFRDAAEAAT